MENFRPIDFLVGGYGTCMMGIMAKVAGENGFSLSSTRTEIGFEMLADNSRVDTITVKCLIQKDNYTPDQKQILESAAKKCPIEVSNSFAPQTGNSFSIS